MQGKNHNSQNHKYPGIFTGQRAGNVMKLTSGGLEKGLPLSSQMRKLHRNFQDSEMCLKDGKEKEEFN